MRACDVVEVNRTHQVAVAVHPRPVVRHDAQVEQDGHAEVGRALPDQAIIGVAINEAVRLSVDSGGRFVTFGKDLRPKLA